MDEIEYKFLLEKFIDLDYDKKIYIYQAYIKNDSYTSRIRACLENDNLKFFHTLKGAGLIKRSEIEHVITQLEFIKLHQNIISSVSKIRYIKKIDEFKFEVDHFLEFSENIVTCEVEVDSLDSNLYNKIIEVLNKLNIKYIDVSLDPKYKNSNISKHFKKANEDIKTMIFKKMGL